MPSWSANLSATASSWCVIVRIDGIGDASGQWSFCSNIPGYGDQSYKPWLVELPEFLSERVDPSGGFPEAGSCSLRLLDVGDALTSLLRTETEAYSVVDEPVDSTETSIEVRRNTSLADKVIWIGSEAMRVDSVASSPTRINVTRGHLGTDAVTHARRDPFFLWPNYLEGRRFSVYLAPLDGTGTTDERLVGSYVIESLDWSKDLNVWQIKGASQQRYLDRQAPISPRRTTISKLPSVGPGMEQERALVLASAGIVPLWSDLMAYVSVESEILQVYGKGLDSIQTAPYDLALYREIRQRGVHGSKTGALAKDQKVTQVFLAGRDIRVSPGPSPSTSRSSGTWNSTANPIDLMLVLLLSSASKDDGLELTNRATTGSDWARSNFSSLPPGYGAGIPHTLIDWPSWEAVRARCLAYNLPLFAYGGEDPESFAELIARHFLRPLGLFLSFESGKFRISMMRIPTSSETAALTLDSSNILRREDGSRQYLPAISVSRERLEGIGAVAYLLGPQKLQALFRNGDFSRTYGQRGWYGAVEPTLKIEVPGADPNEADLWGARAQARLFRHHRPAVTLSAECDVGAFSSALVGSYVGVTLPELPDLANGTRTWTNGLAEVIERELTASPERSTEGSGEGLVLNLRVRRYGASVRIGKLCPAAAIASVSGDTATIAANRYTIDADTLGLPQKDGLAFAVGDKLILCDPDGKVLENTPEDIVTATATTIELSGNFGGLLAAGKILTYAKADDSRSEQTGVFVHLADQAEQTVGALTQTAWKWGEI